MQRTALSLTVLGLITACGALAFAPRTSSWLDLEPSPVSEIDHSKPASPLGHVQFNCQKRAAGDTVCTVASEPGV